MKALLLVSEMEDYAIAFASGLVHSVSVTLCVPRRQYGALAGCFDPAIDLRLLEWPRHRSAGNLRFLVALSRLIQRERPDIIHLLSNGTIWLNLAAPFWRPIPLVTTVHDVSRHPGDRETARLPAWATTLIVHQSGDVVVHGETLRQAALQRFSKAPEQLHVLPHPALPRYADLARAQGLQRRTDAFTLLFFGRLFAYKGIDQLVDAEALIGARIPELRVAIAGRGDDPWALIDRMGDPARYAISNRFIEDREVAQLFLDADLVVLPYAEASQSGVLNIACAFGKPVIVTDVGELGHTVGRAGFGLVVPPLDAERLAEAILQLYGDPARRAELGDRALAWASGPNSPDAVGAQTAELYRHIIERKAACR